MVEQRSPKPSVACSSRVSPAKKGSPIYIGLLFYVSRFATRTRNAIAAERYSLRLRLHLTLRGANKFAMLRYISRFALSRVASPLPRREVLFIGLLFLYSFSATRTRNAIAAERYSLRLRLHLTLRVASDIATLSQLRNI